MNSNPTGLRAVDHWERLARQWALIKPPLRPVAEDLAFTTQAIQEWHQANGQKPPTILVLGVTRELCELALNEGAQLFAVDHSADMIGALWPRERPGQVFCAAWREMPLPDNSVDFILADGSFSLVNFPDGCVEVGTELLRLLRPGGRVVVRCFAQRRESRAAVFADLDAGRIGSFAVLKWRLAMALQPSAEMGVLVREVWAVLHERWPDLKLLAEQFEWPLAEVRTLEAYRNAEGIYRFPTVAEYERVFAEAGLPVVRVCVPRYELGERCPTLVLKRQRVSKNYMVTWHEDFKQPVRDLREQVPTQ